MLQANQEQERHQTSLTQRQLNQSNVSIVNQQQDSIKKQQQEFTINYQNMLGVIVVIFIVLLIAFSLDKSKQTNQEKQKMQQSSLKQVKFSQKIQANNQYTLQQLKNSQSQLSQSQEIIAKLQKNIKIAEADNQEIQSQLKLSQNTIAKLQNNLEEMKSIKIQPISVKAQDSHQRKEIKNSQNITKQSNDFLQNKINNAQMTDAKTYTQLTKIFQNKTEELQKTTVISQIQEIKAFPVQNQTIKAISQQRQRIKADSVSVQKIQNKKNQTNTQEKKIQIVPQMKKTKIVPIYQSLSYKKYNLDKYDALSQILDIPFDKNRSSNLPLEFMTVNQFNQTIQSVLYNQKIGTSYRMAFSRDRQGIIDRHYQLKNAHLAKYNLITFKEKAQKAIDENVKEWLRLQKDYNLSKITTQLPMCIIVTGFNNNAKYRIEQNLNSIFTQNYTKYRTVVIDDASTDGSRQVYRAYFKFYNINPEKYLYIQNKIKTTALQNIYVNSIKYCSYDDIVITLDADDQFIGRNVLKLFNWAYQTKKAGVIYSNFYQIRQTEQHMQKGYTQDYTQQQKNNNKYRGVSMKFGHLRSYRNQLLHQVKPISLKDQKGNFFDVTYDMAMFFPLMELACGRVHKIQNQFNYLYNYDTGLNDQIVRRKEQLDVVYKLRKRQKYGCSRKFYKKMKQLN